jgi:hypothetical protein
MSRPPPATLGLVPPGPKLGSEPGSMLQRIVLKQFHFILFHLIYSITLHQPAGTTRFLPCSLFLVLCGFVNEVRGRVSDVLTPKCSSLSPSVRALISSHSFDCREPFVPVVCFVVVLRESLLP